MVVGSEAVVMRAHLTPMRVANVSMPNCLSPSMSGRSLVMAITVANRVTKAVMKLRGGGGTGWVGFGQVGGVGWKWGGADRWQQVGWTGGRQKRRQAQALPSRAKGACQGYRPP